MTENKRIDSVCRCLEENSVDYEIFYHDAAFTIAECEKIEKKIGSKICKNLLLTTTSGSVYYLLMLSGEKKFVTKEVSKMLDTSRLSFASPEKMRELLNTEPGSLSVTSLVFDSEKDMFKLIGKVVKCEFEL